MRVYLYYRTYWGDNNGPGWLGRTVIAKNKLELVDVCIKSMNLSNIEIIKYAFIDNPTSEYENFISKHFDKIIHTAEGKDIDDIVNGWPVFGSVGSLIRLFEFMLDNQHKDNDVILLVEDDYLFAPDAINKWVKAVQSLGDFVTPFDHPDRYIRSDDLYAKKTRIQIVSNHHWRQSESCTSVIGGTFKTFRKTFFLRKIPRLYAKGLYPERIIGRELPGVDRVFCRRAHYLMGINIYSPIPGIACHLSKFVPPTTKKLIRKGVETPETQLSPGYDWDRRYKEILETT